MMNTLEEIRNKLVHFLFPFVSRFYLVTSMVLFLAAVSLPETYHQVKVVLFWLWFVIVDINSEGIMERDYLPIQTGSSPFYHIYRFINSSFLLFLFIYLVIMLIPGSLLIKDICLGVFIIVVILNAIGDRKYRPKKPEE